MRNILHIPKPGTQTEEKTERQTDRQKGKEQQGLWNFKKKYRRNRRADRATNRQKCKFINKNYE